MTEKNINYIAECAELHPGLSIDCVIITYHERKLKVLLNKSEIMGKWMLPGGFVKNKEDIDAAAIRILLERTGMKDIYLKQFQTFGNVDRVDIEENKRILNRFTKTSKIARRFFGMRFVTIGYFALVKYDDMPIQAEKESDNSQWVDIKHVPPLYVDHNYIIEEALNMIKLMIDHFPLCFQLLPKKFILPELKALYEGILGYPLDKRNFQKKMLTSGLITRLDERKPVNTSPQPYYYIFNSDQNVDRHKSDLPEEK